MRRKTIFCLLVGVISISCNIAQTLPSLIPGRPTPTRAATRTPFSTPTFTPLPTIDPIIGLSNLGWLVERFQLTGHVGAVRAVDFSPDSKILASAGEDGFIILWDVITGERVQTLSGQHDWIMALAFSPQDTLLASGSTNNNIIFWDWNAGQSLATISGHTDGIVALAFSPDGKILASASWDESIRLLEVETRLTKYILRGHKDSIMDMVISPDGRFLASSDVSGTVIVWDVEKGKRLKTLEGYHLAFTPDSGLLAISGENTIRFLEVESGQEMKTFGNAYYCDMNFSPDGSLLVAQSCGGYDISLLDASNGNELRELYVDTSGWIQDVVVSPDGKYLAIACDGGKLILMGIGSQR